MPFWVHGTDKNTGQPRDPLFVETEDAASAEAEAVRAEMTVEEVEYVDPKEYHDEDSLEERVQPSPARSLDQLIFVGFNGYALALDRDNGDVVWYNSEMKSGYVSLLLDGDRLIVSTDGYMYCLDPFTGTILWHNPLSGYGTGPAHLVSVRGQSAPVLLQQAAGIAAASSVQP